MTQQNKNVVYQVQECMTKAIENKLPLPSKIALAAAGVLGKFIEDKYPDLQNFQIGPEKYANKRECGIGFKYIFEGGYFGLLCTPIGGVRIVFQLKPGTIRRAQYTTIADLPDGFLSDTLDELDSMNKGIRA